jgi:ectoine hydroxylase-related dioxygenase (phytanoyl-CoA dioxygenase family)
MALTSLVRFLGLLLLLYFIGHLHSFQVSRNIVNSRQNTIMHQSVTHQARPPVLAALPSDNNKRQHTSKNLRKQIFAPLINIDNKEVPGTQKIQNNSGPRSVVSAQRRYRGTNITSSIVPTKIPDIPTQLQYSRNGHAVIRQLLSPKPIEELRSELVHFGNTQELAAWRQKVYVAADHNPLMAQQLLDTSCQTINDCKKQMRRLLRTEHISLPFLQYFNVWRTNPAVYNLAKSLAHIAATFMDVTSVRLYQDSIFWKRPGDGPTPWHTDARMAPFDTSHMITIWIPLQPVYHSGLIFCSKSHNDFALPYWNDVSSGVNDPTSPWNHLDKRYHSATSCCDYMPLALGDVTVHSGWTLHCADAFNPTSTKQQQVNDDRMALAITYVDAHAPVRDPITFISSSKCDSEDMWSYQDWVHDVPYNVSRWDHPLVPIVWSSSKKVSSSNGKRVRK